MKIKIEVFILLILAVVLYIKAFTVQAVTFVVTNTNDSGQGSLRQAILDANSNAGFDQIKFQIPESSSNTPKTPKTIKLIAPLPQITSPILIDGWSQTGQQMIGIEIRMLNCSSFLEIMNGADGSQIQGLAINLEGECTNFPHGIFINTSNVVIASNYIGLDLNGQSSGIQFNSGIVCSDTKPNTNIEIQNNIIAGNKTNIILFCSDSRISGNIIGLTSDGNSIEGQITGISVRGQNILIGGTQQNERNIFSGHEFTGIRLSKVNSVNVINNYIGTTTDGLYPKPNGIYDVGSGILFDDNGSQNVLIKGNVLAFNKYTQVRMISPLVNVRIENNIIGLNAQGEGSSPGDGIKIFGEPEKDKNIVIENNTISSNKDVGIKLGNGYDITIRENHIGTGINNDEPKGNSTGILTYNNTENITIEKNIIANGVRGIEMQITRDINIVNNTIKNNTEMGVWPTFNVFNVSILSNSIFDNDLLGIDLVDLGNNSGVSPNDPGDKDLGSNFLMNYPVLSSAMLTNNFLSLTFSLDIDSSSALIQFFANTSVDSSGHGEGEIYLGQATVTKTTDKNHTVIIPLPNNVDIAKIENISATTTATPEFGSVTESTPAIGMNTSEFSKTIKIKKGNVPVDLGDTPDAGIGTSPYNYQTTIIDNGPFHIFDGTLYLGTCVDADPGTLQNNSANADDLSVSQPRYGACSQGKDEDGIIMPTMGFIAGQKNNIQANVYSNPSYAGAHINVWIDYNKDGDFVDSGEYVFINKVVVSGTNQLTFTIPRGVSGTTYMRTRLTRQKIDDLVIASTGGVKSGEVEDYRIHINELLTPSSSEDSLINNQDL